MAPKPRGSGASIVKTKSSPLKGSDWTAEISAEARVTQSHGHGTSKECGPRNSCRSRNYFLSFGLIVTFARCGSFMTYWTAWKCYLGDVAKRGSDTRRLSPGSLLVVLLGAFILLSLTRCREILPLCHVYNGTATSDGLRGLVYDRRV
ncbi:hypothetical protein VNO77_12425 [Canavalia gladiata]|uniref:Uncharacterized protein n=1 Tax=Canavalia gladiata TaxID=3824 RepID=A0AAN9LWA1_CANGL